jgi:hypothetical protein
VVSALHSPFLISYKTGFSKFLFIMISLNEYPFCKDTEIPNIAVKWVFSTLRIPEVLASYLSQERGNPDRSSDGFPQCLPANTGT